MPVYFNTNQLPGFKNAVLTIGTFDGVHHGHRQILEEVVQHARQTDGESIVITFEPHPRKLLFPDQSLGLLTPLQQKIELILATGIEHIVVVSFTRDFSSLSAKEYIRDFLVKHFHPSTIIIGYDHHFGHDRTGNLQLMKEMEQVFGYTTREIPAQLIDEAAVSSTKIRKAVAEGRIEDAAHMLDRYYAISGTVISGARLGRTIGYPTANIAPLDGDQLIPAIGIYAVFTDWKKKRYRGMLSIGHNPTVTDEKVINIEVNIFDFNHDIYGEELTIHFVARLRNEEKFPSLDALKEQLHQDKLNALSILDAL